MGGKFPFFHLINHTEMMWSTFFFFSHRFYSMSPWRVSTANQTKSSSVQPSTTNHSQAKYEELSNRAFTVMQISVCREDQTEWTCFFFFCSFSVSSSHGVQSHLLPLWFYLQHLLSRHPFIFYTSALLSLPLPSPPSVLLVCGQRYQALSINSEAIR